jgi:hypothetical protein
MSWSVRFHGCFRSADEVSCRARAGKLPYFQVLFHPEDSPLGTPSHAALGPPLLSRG